MKRGDEHRSDKRVPAADGHLRPEGVSVSAARVKAVEFRFPWSTIGKNLLEAKLTWPCFLHAGLEVPSFFFACLLVQDRR